MSDILNETIGNIARKAYENHTSIREKMLIQEFERIIHEQIKSGDFIQHVCQSSKSFSLTYAPYRERLRLKADIKFLISLVECGDMDDSEDLKEFEEIKKRNSNG